MDPPPVTTFLLYLVVWAAWVYTHDILVQKQKVNFSLKLDDILYDDNVSFLDIQFSDNVFM
tara:strand:- start:578 stop:760 length:183 start_codon:yes stop_codon:yes gene_type:complete